MKVTAGAAVAAAAIGVGGYYWYTTLPKPKPKLRYLGHAFYLPEDAVVEWKELYDQEIEATYQELWVVCQTQVADPKGWDVGGGGRYRPVIDAGVCQPIPLETMPRWQEDKLIDLFNHSDKYFRPAQAERFDSLLWHERGKSLISVPCMWNFDSVTYLPEFIPYEEKGGTKTSISYSELWNPEWKGRAGMQGEGFTVFSETCNELEATGQMAEVENITGLKDSEVDEIFNFLLPIVKAGQIKTFWFKYGDIVHLLSTKELYISSTWQPPCFDTRKAGTPAYYARLVNGPFFWYNSNYVSKYTDPDKLEDCYKLMNWCLDLYMSMLYTKQGYPTPAWGWDDYREGMGHEFFDWFHMGKATYTPIDEVMKEIWPDKPEFAELPERLQNALFSPDVYFRHFWTGEPPRTGSPHTKGNLRDIGSNEDKVKITRYFLSPDLPDNNDYYVKKYEELLANIPV